MLKEKLLQFTCYMVIILPLYVTSVEENKLNGNETFAIELTEENFEKALIKNNHFIKFYAPWCGHCKRLHPLWEELAEMMNVKDDPQVVIAKVDCTQQKELCAKHEITGYPTLRFFKLGDKESVKFTGTRDMPAITEFINQQLNVDGVDDNDDIKDETKSEILFHEDAVKPIDELLQPVKGELVELTEENFARLVSSGNHFVKFYAPWCSHCQRLVSTWRSLAKTLENEENVSIGKIDCTIYKSICQDFDVKGYPTLLWIEDGKKIEKYSGSRDHDTLQSYVFKMLGVDSADATEVPQRVVSKPNEDAANLNTLELTAANFEKSISNGITFVKFYAPWCGHCKKLSPIWDELATILHTLRKETKIAKVDCTATENRKLCMDEQVEGYPTLFAYRNGKRLSEYNGSRSLEEMIKYINNLQNHDEL